MNIHTLAYGDTYKQAKAYIMAEQKHYTKEGFTSTQKHWSTEGSIKIVELYKE